MTEIEYYYSDRELDNLDDLQEGEIVLFRQHKENKFALRHPETKKVMDFIQAESMYDVKRGGGHAAGIAINGWKPWVFPLLNEEFVIDAGKVHWAKFVHGIAFDPICIGNSLLTTYSVPPPTNSDE